MLLLLGISGCTRTVDPIAPRGEAEATLMALLTEATYDAYDDVPGATMTVVAPKVGLDWTGAAGFDSHTREDSLGAEQPFRIASVTKAFVAAAVLRLHELDTLHIDDPLALHLSEPHVQLLAEGGYDMEQITIRQTLNHTAGFYDFIFGGPTYVDQILKNPQRRWTRTEQLALAVEMGEPVYAPGEQYHYNDTGYILLGEVIERCLGLALGEALRELLRFGALGLDATWLESIDPAPDHQADPVHRYFRNHDATEWDPSVDLYGGGGLVSTTPQLASFIQALFNGAVFDDAATLALMLEPARYAPSYDSASDPRYSDYRLGLWRTEAFGHEVYLHDGFWGVSMVHIPDYNASIAINYVDGYRDRLLKKTLLLLKHLHAQDGGRDHG